jgi:hypothetical protein
MRQVFSSALAGRPGGRRRGIALVGALAALMLVSAMMASIGWHMAANRRMAEHRQDEIQAGWLARGGIELAAIGLLDAPDKYKGETAKPAPRSEVRVTVEREEGAKDVFRVVSEVRYHADVRTRVVRSIERRLRRVSDGSKVRIEVLPAKKTVAR